MIYHLYFKSGERAYNLKLYEESEKGKTYETQLFANNRGGVELLRLEYKHLKLVSHQNSQKDKKAYIESFTNNGYQLDIYLAEKERAPKYPESDLFAFEKENDFLLIKNQGSDEAETFTIVFHYQEGNKNFTGKITVDCIPDDDIYDAVLDFGSEASQMMISKESTLQKCELFNGCARHFYGLDPAKIADRTYDQQEDGDDELFRSVYFLPRQMNDTQDVSQAVVATPGEDDPLLEFITKRDDPDKGQRLPNIKISYLSGEHPDNVNPNDLHQGIVMRFIHEAVMEVMEKRRGRLGKCGIRLYLLVPNVMEQGQLSDFLKDIRKHTDAPEFRQLLPEAMKDVVFDIHSYSESDASFVSWLDNVEPGNYLIIDVGKGTTDFSIIKVENGQNAISIYRSGFVGAGNALTYAIFVNYVVSMGGITKAKDIIKKVLYKAEDAELYRLENILESYKKKENPVIKKDSELKIEEKMEVGTIIDRIKERGDIGDDYQIIQSTINHIIRKIVVNVKETQFKKVILSGRAFKYQPFQKATISILEKTYQMEGNVIALDDEQLKKGCLFGPLKSIQISKQSDMIGIPIAVDRAKRKDEKAQLEKYFDDVLTKVVSHRDIAPKENGKPSWMEWSKKIWWSIRDTLSTNIGESATQERRGSKTVNLKADNDDIRSIMRGELSIGKCDENTHFYIADDEYETDNHQILNKDSKYNLFFDGNDFWVKDKKNSIRLKPCIQVLNNDMLYESLFPYPYRILDENYEIPDINGN